MPGRHALLIATETYADPALRRLTAPGGDARALAEVLSDPAIAGFEVTTLVDQPHHVVGEAIGEFYRGRRRDELTLLYFTGHGVKDDDGSLYLAMANTRRDSLMFTALAADQVERALAGCASRQKVLVLDCCYSGAFPAGKLAKAGTDVHTLERFQGRGRAVLTASDATQYSFEGDAVVGTAARSVFTRHLVAGLRDGSADLDHDGDVTVDELYSYVHEHVVAEMPRQRPKHQSDVEGRIVLARNPRWTLPEYLRHGLASPIASDRLTALEGLRRLNRVGNEVVRERTEVEIRRLVDDDSRRVSAAAQAWVAAAAAAASVAEMSVSDVPVAEMSVAELPAVGVGEVESGQPVVEVSPEEGGPQGEAAPVGEKVPVGKEAPVGEAARVREKVPVVEVPAEVAPVGEAAPVGEVAPLVGAAPPGEEAPLMETAPAPVEEVSPVESVVEEAPPIAPVAEPPTAVVKPDVVVPGTMAKPDPVVPAVAAGGVSTPVAKRGSPIPPVRRVGSAAKAAPVPAQPKPAGPSVKRTAPPAPDVPGSSARDARFYLGTAAVIAVLATGVLLTVGGFSWVVLLLLLLFAIFLGLGLGGLRRQSK
ncbi:caspase family protein [Amycolatopsis sp. NPDC088138]|uniref:caspase, EACC1-associated type n=1 Tax=Amycolatopsis sp. NPDC088138 TaxID=3363938 RepID=UPI00382878CC